MKAIEKTIASTKAIIASMNPKKEALKEASEKVNEQVESLKPTSKNENYRKTQEAILAASKQRLENYAHKSEKQEIDYRDLTVEITHAKYNASLLELDAKTVQYVIRKEVDLASAVNKSREYKKRLKSFLTACAHKDATKLDKALNALQTSMKTSKKMTYSKADIQRIMEHKTATQAGYFCTFGKELKMLSELDKETVQVNKESEFYKDFIAI